MAFKLGKEIRHDGTHSARIPSNPFKFGGSQLGINTLEQNTPGMSTGSLNEPGVLAQANNDGTTDIHSSVDPKSAFGKRIGAHEDKHHDDMKSGRAAYDDNTVTWEGDTHNRINVNGKWGVMWEGTFREDGWKGFPWEQSAIKAE